MSTLGKVRANGRIFELMPNSYAFWAGVHLTRRDHNLDMARRFKQAGQPSMVKLFVDFARDDQRKYLGYFREIRKAVTVRSRLASYELTVLDRIRGVMNG
jgi:hypothetical protein